MTILIESMDCVFVCNVLSERVVVVTISNVVDVNVQDLWVADDLDAARAEGTLRRPVLTVRFSFFCVEDTIELHFNGRSLRENAQGILLCCDSLCQVVALLSYSST